MYLGVHRFGVGLREGFPKGERAEVIVVEHATDAAGNQSHALGPRGAASLVFFVRSKTAVDNSIVGKSQVARGRRAHPEIGALRPPALAQVLRANLGVHAAVDGPEERVSQHHAKTGVIPQCRHQEAGAAGHLP